MDFGFSRHMRFKPRSGPTVVGSVWAKDDKDKKILIGLITEEKK